LKLQEDFYKTQQIQTLWEHLNKITLTSISLDNKILVITHGFKILYKIRIIHLVDNGILLIEEVQFISTAIITQDGFGDLKD